MLNGLFAASSTAALRRIGRSPRGRFNELVFLLTTLMAIAPWAYILVLRNRVLHWGATHAETHERLPGDEVVRYPSWESTRAIDIAAPVEAVWPWLAQMGQDKAGLYSYEWLENLAGLEFHNADRIIPEWGLVNVGDFVRLAPSQDTLVVERVEPTRSLVWRVLNPRTHQPGDLAHGAAAFDATWAFVLRPIDATHARLIQRFRFGCRPLALVLLYTALIEIPHFVMERRMLLGIRERAER
jgi:hypothetical protein